jgi:hypothetical protein
MAYRGKSLPMFLGSESLMSFGMLALMSRLEGERAPELMLPAGNCVASLENNILCQKNLTLR